MELFYYFICFVAGVITGFVYIRVSPTKLISDAVRDYGIRKNNEQNAENMRMLKHDKVKLAETLRNTEQELLDTKLKLSAAEKANKIHSQNLTHYKHKENTHLQELRQIREELARSQQDAENRKAYQEHLQNMHASSFSNLMETQKKKIINDIQELITPLKQQLEIDNKNRDNCVNTIQTLFHNTDAIQKTLVSHVNAFTKNFKIPGTWGEQQLVSLLRAHGLCENIDYTVNIIGDNHHNFVIKYAENARITIDTGLPLEHYRLFANTNNQNEADKHIKLFAKAIRDKIDLLTAKEKEGDNDNFTIIYVPTENALMVAFNHDPDLYEYGIKRKIIITSTGLVFILLRSLQHIKQHDLYNKNILRIAGEMKNLVNKFELLVEHINKVRHCIITAYRACQSSVRHITTGKDSILNTIEAITEYNEPERGKAIGDALNAPDPVDMEHSSM